MAIRSRTADWGIVSNALVTSTFAKYSGALELPREALKVFSLA